MDGKDSVDESRRRLSLGMLAGAGALAAGPLRSAYAQTYPERPLKLVVPFAAGGGADAAGRLVGRHLAERLGQPVLIENRGGAGGVVGTNSVAKSPADGYTLLMTAHSFVPIFFKSLPFNFSKEVAPVSAAYSGGFLLITRGNTPAKSLQEFIAAVRSRPGKFNYGVATTQSMLTAEIFKRRAGVDLTKIQYRGEPNVVAAMLADEIDLAISTPTAYRSFLESGKLRALAVTSKLRSPLFPEVPTLEEAGFANFVVSYTSGIWVPAGTPAPIISRLSAEIAAVMQLPDVQAYFRNQVGAIAAGSSPQAFAAAAQREIQFFEEAARLTGYEPE